MKQFTIAVTILLLVITISHSCDDDYTDQVEKPKSEKIAGEEKKELEAYMAFIDSVQKSSFDLPTDTSGFQKGSFICYDSLAMTSQMPKAGKMLAYAQAEMDGKKLFKFSTYDDLKSILKGETQKASYKAFLEKLNQKKYLVVIKNVAFVEPKMRNKSEFDNGQILSLIQVIDLKKLVIVKNILFQAENSDEVTAIKDFYETENSYDSQLLPDLWQNYAENLAEELENLFN